MKFFFDLIYALKNYPDKVVFKIVEGMMSYVFLTMLCMFMSGAAMNAGSTCGTIIFLVAAIVIYGTKGNPVEWFRGGDILMGNNFFDS